MPPCFNQIRRILGVKAVLREGGQGSSQKAKDKKLLFHKAY